MDTMKLKRFDHVGIVVNDLQTARRLLENGFGLTAIRDIKRPNLSATFFKCGDVSIELIEVHDPLERSQRLGPGETARIEHVAFEVDSLNDAIAGLEKLGIKAAAPRATPENVSSWTEAPTKWRHHVPVSRAAEERLRPSPHLTKV